MRCSAYATTQPIFGHAKEEDRAPADINSPINAY